MAAPTPVTLADPAGSMLRNGYRALVGIAADTDIALWVKDITPPKVDGGEMINISTMHNDDFETYCFAALADLGEISFNAGYEVNTYAQCLAIVNTPSTVTVLFPSNRTMTVFGGLRSFIPGNMINRQMCMAACVIGITNYDEANSVEAGPVFGTAS